MWQIKGITYPTIIVVDFVVKKDKARKTTTTPIPADAPLQYTSVFTAFGGTSLHSFSESFQFQYVTATAVLSFALWDNEMMRWSPAAFL